MMAQYLLVAGVFTLYGLCYWLLSAGADFFTQLLQVLA